MMQHNPTNTKRWTPSEVAKITFSAIIFVIVFASNALAVILQVPNYYLTIQEAINSCEPGDTIIVASGVYRLYSGNIIITKESITLKSAYGAKKTIIEGRGGPVITFVEDSRSVIDGFTITSVSDTKDAKALKGGGIYCAPRSSPTIINNVITGNTALFGAGIYCDEASSPTIVNSAIWKNNAVRSGGGIFSYKASPSIPNSRIIENGASNAGGGFYCYKGSPRISNTIIWKNTATSGGGISSEKSSCSIINVTMTRNVAAYGGGIFFEGGTVRVINNILWDNKDDLYSGLFTAASKPDHTDIEDGDFRGVNGNISADPLFADPENGDFHLLLGSPCADAGNPDIIYDDPDGSRNDMGAYGGPEASKTPPLSTIGMVE